jgi:hypothetical protein
VLNKQTGVLCVCSCVLEWIDHPQRVMCDIPWCVLYTFGGGGGGRGAVDKGADIQLYN